MGTKDEFNEKAQQAKRKTRGDRSQEPRRGQESSERMDEPARQQGQERRGQDRPESREEAEHMSRERRQQGRGDEMMDQEPFEEM